LTGCTKEEGVGLYNPNASYAPAPTITGISPAGGAFAGMDTITIQGTNFSSTVGQNVVFFNAQPAQLLSASPTRITLGAPLVTSDSIGVRVAVTGALAFSNTAQYKLIAGVAQFGGLAATELSSSAAVDAAGNLYAGYSSAGTEAGILKFTPTGSRTKYALATSGVVSWSGLKMGPGGYLYSTRSFRAIYRFSPGGGAASALWLAFPTGTSITDLDFDKDGNAWGVGNNSSIYRIQQDKTITTYPFVGNARSARVYNNYLYFAARTDAGEKIWRAPITAGALGTAEVYFDFSAAYPTATPLAITFSSDGILYIGTDAPDGLIVVSPNRSYSAPFAAYRASFGTGVGSLAWGKADDLYASTVNGLLLKIIVRGKTSATYFGSTL